MDCSWGATPKPTFIEHIAGEENNTNLTDALHTIIQKIDSVSASLSEFRLEHARDFERLGQGGGSFVARPSQRSLMSYMTARAGLDSLTGSMIVQAGENLMPGEGGDTNNWDVVGTVTNDPTKETSKTESDCGHELSKRSIGRFIRASNFLQMRRNGRPEIYDTIWKFLEDPEFNLAASIYNKAVQWFILLSVAFTLMQTIPNFDDYIVTLEVTGLIELIIELMFLLEFLVSLTVTPSRKVYLANYYTCLDIICVLPLIIRFYLMATITFDPRDMLSILLHLLVPILRLLKMIKRFHTFKLLVRAFILMLEVLPFLLFTQFFLILLFSSMVYIAEPYGQFENFPHTMWFTLVTMTTVGFGDVTPQEPLSIVFSYVLVLVSVLYMAIPLGIVGYTFTNVWEDRDQILLMHRVRSRLTHWGYTPHDIPVLFDLFDSSGAGEMSLSDFTIMINSMNIGLDNSRVVRLFDSIDADRGGSIGAKELVKVLFPEFMEDIYPVIESHFSHITTEKKNSDDGEPRRETPQTSIDLEASDCSKSSVWAGLTLTNSANLFESEGKRSVGASSAYSLPEIQAYSRATI